MQPIIQDCLLLLNLYAVISKWYPSTACQLNDRKFECVFPAYCYCHSIFRHWKHVLSGCLQTHHCIYSTWDMGANLPCLPPTLNQTLLWTSTWLPIFSWGFKNLKLLVLNVCNHLSSSAHIVEWVQSFRLHWGKWILQSWQKRSPMETNHLILLFFFLNSFHSI